MAENKTVALVRLIADSTIETAQNYGNNAWKIEKKRNFSPQNTKIDFWMRQGKPDAGGGQ